MTRDANVMCRPLQGRILPHKTKLVPLSKPLQIIHLARLPGSIHRPQNSPIPSILGVRLPLPAPVLSVVDPRVWLEPGFRSNCHGQPNRTTNRAWYSDLVIEIALSENTSEFSKPQRIIAQEINLPLSSWFELEEGTLLCHGRARRYGREREGVGGNRRESDDPYYAGRSSAG
jgi:hypothetical protein